MKSTQNDPPTTSDDCEAFTEAQCEVGHRILIDDGDGGDYRCPACALEEARNELADLRTERDKWAKLTEISHEGLVRLMAERDDRESFALRMMRRGMDQMYDDLAKGRLSAPKNAAGGRDLDDDMCPNCLTPWKCNGPHLYCTETTLPFRAVTEEWRTLVDHHDQYHAGREFCVPNDDPLCSLLIAIDQTQVGGMP